MEGKLNDLLTISSKNTAKYPRCKICGGWGKDLVDISGNCNHCNSILASEEKHPAKKIKLETEEEVIARLLMESENFQDIKLDQQGIRQLVKELKEKMEKNILSRNKYKGDPLKYVESEADLCEQIAKLNVIATVPQYYPDLIKNELGFVLTELLQHENLDITIELLKLIYELTDISHNENEEEGIYLFIEDLYKRQFFKIMITRIRDFDEKSEDDANGVFYSLSIVENIMEIMPEYANKFCLETDIIKYILKRIETRSFDQNKLYSSEILAILIQSDPNCRDFFAELVVDDHPAILSLLKSISVWKKRDPCEDEERECLENLFDALCVLLMNETIRKQFLKVDGYILVKMILDANKYSKACALKCLDYSTQDSKENAKYLIDNNFLKYIMPSYLGRGLGHKLRNKEEVNLIVDHLISLVENMLSLFSENEDQLQRILRKFVENDYEKTERTIELFKDYWEKVSKVTLDISDLSAEEYSDQLYLLKLDAGLLTLQKLSFIIGRICILEDISNAIPSKLKIRNLKIQELIICLEDYYDSFDGGVLKEKKELVLENILRLKKIQ